MYILKSHKFQHFERLDGPFLMCTVLNIWSTNFETSEDNVYINFI